MTRSLEEANDLSALDAQVLREIHTDGWQITGVLARGPDGADFAYSIGFFHSMVHPEIILFGLPLDTGMHAVNVIGIDIKNGMRYDPDRVYDRILKDPHLCCFKEVDSRHYREHIGYALWFYESDPFPMYQCFWSDENGLFPWDEGCNPIAVEAQPLLYLR